MSGIGNGPGNSAMMMVNRMHARHRLLLDAYRDVIVDSNVLHLGAEDGRWCYAFASAGAARVVGVEQNAEPVSKFSRHPDIGLRERIDLRCADPMKELAAEVQAERRYDVVAMFDLLENVADLFLLFSHIRALAPRLVILDGVFLISDDPVLRMVNHPVPSGEGEGPLRPRAVPGPRALQVIAEALDYELEWVDWTQVPENQRVGLSDYFVTDGQKRASCTMVPRGL
ncbi:class I SAM-dependent methyltransferase [Litorivita pollutaquae]|uniref:Class I SAM-dependent methyltransferase n=1 Tax=Litorivita pollutaquae TaxID=2200892 RepID=A0A2V4NKK5_9RHOB|nr:class I SAM-dependent methyltransferase [Litorivita pollutaquae]PYC46737.1 class I SAM-dependent methyltransferase [Litorivita pollutaquae]